MSAPVFQSKYGSIQIAVWQNQVKSDKGDFTSHSVSIVKPYKKADKWVNGNSFNISDIPYIVMGLLDVFRWKYAKDTPEVAVDDTPSF